MSLHFTVHLMEDWKTVARAVIDTLQAGDILTLSGPLGAGKTTFTQALASELGVQISPRSPTFSLMRMYLFPERNGMTRLIHIDAYRLEKSSDILALNLEEERDEPGTILVIEWPEQISSWLQKQKGVKRLKITLGTGEEREVVLEEDISE